MQSLNFLLLTIGESGSSNAFISVSSSNSSQRGFLALSVLLGEASVTVVFANCLFQEAGSCSAYKAGRLRCSLVDAGILKSVLIPGNRGFPYLPVIITRLCIKLALSSCSTVLGYFIIFLCTYLFGVLVCMCQGMCVVVRGRLAGVSSCLLSCGSWELDPGHQAWQQGFPTC